MSESLISSEAEEEVEGQKLRVEPHLEDFVVRTNREISHFNSASEQNHKRSSRWSPNPMAAAAATSVPLGRRGPAEQRSSGTALCQLTQQSISTDGGQLLNAASLMITSTGTTRLISRGCSLAPLTAEQHWLPVIKHRQLLECCVCACEAQVRGGGSGEASTSWKLFTRSTLRQMFDASG